MKKLFAIIMSMLMIACFMPTMAFAADGNVAKYNNTEYATLQAAIDASKEAKEQNVVIDLLSDATIDIAPWEEKSLTSEGTETLTINGNNHTLAFNYTNSDWNHVYTNGATLILNNMTLKHTGYGVDSGVWNNHDINFACDVKMTGVTSNNALAFKAAADLTNVKITDSVQTSVYLIWIVPHGQTISLKNCEIDGTTASDGRCIKVDDQYQQTGENKKITLNVTETTFKSNSGKPAIYLNTPAGADVTLENIDITNVKADSENAVWLDTNSKSNSNAVSIKGGQIKDVEMVASIDGMQYASLQAAVSALPNVANGEALPAVTTIKLLKDTNGGFDFGLEKERRAVNAVLDLNGKTLTLGPAIGSKGTETNGIRTLAYSKLEIKNGTLKCSDLGVDVTTAEGPKTRYTKVGIANYSITTLENVNVEAGARTIYTINNGGELNLKGTTTVETGKNEVANDNPDLKRSAINNQPYHAYYTAMNASINVDSKDVTVGKMVIFTTGSGSNANTEGKSEINISAGTYGDIITEETGDKVIWNITGGTFSSDPSAYVADNYVATKSGETWTVKAKSTSGGGGGFVVIPTETPLDKAKTEANTAISAAASANKYDEAEQAEVKAILDKAAADIKNAKTEEEVKAIQEAVQAEIEKVLTTEEKAQIAAVGSVNKEIFKAKSKYSKLNGKRAIKITWNVPNGMKFDGFEVFRSTKKFSGYGKTPYFTTTKTSYINSKGLVKGKTYYYKVRAFVIINGEKVYTDYSTKAFRTIK